MEHQWNLKVSANEMKHASNYLEWYQSELYYGRVRIISLLVMK